MVTFQIVSDLHIEYNNNDLVNPLDYIKPSADVLILAGDIGSIYKYKQLYSFLNITSSFFKHLIFVPGNNEYYKVDKYKLCIMDSLKKKLKDLESLIPNLSILDRGSLTFGDICIVGTTLWSDIKCKLPPYIVRIFNMNTFLYKKLFDRDLKYIKYMSRYCKTNNLKMICVTHHSPTFKCIKQSGRNDKFISLYSSAMDNLLNSDYIHTWIYGHTHYNCDFIHPNGTRVVSNQFGKPKDNITDFEKNKIIIF